MNVEKSKASNRLLKVVTLGDWRM